MEAQRLREYFLQNLNSSELHASLNGSRTGVVAAGYYSGISDAQALELAVQSCLRKFGTADACIARIARVQGNCAPCNATSSGIKSYAVDLGRYANPENLPASKVLAPSGMAALENALASQGLSSPRSFISHTVTDRSFGSGTTYVPQNFTGTQPAGIQSYAGTQTYVGIQPTSPRYASRYGGNLSPSRYRTGF